MYNCRYRKFFCSKFSLLTCTLKQKSTLKHLFSRIRTAWRVRYEIEEPFFLADEKRVVTERAASYFNHNKG